MWNPHPRQPNIRGSRGPAGTFRRESRRGNRRSQECPHILKKDEQAKSTAVRAAIALAWGAGGFLLAMGFHRLTGLLIIPASLTGTPAALWEAILGLAVAYLGWRGAGFRHSCNFVGDSGCALFHCEGDRAKVIRDSVFLLRTHRRWQPGLSAA